LKDSELVKLYEQHVSMVYNYAFYRILDRAQAEDITSLVFEKVLRNYARFDSAKSSITTWIMRIARNTLIDYYRTHKTYVALDELGSRELVAEDDDIDIDDSERDLRRLLAVLSDSDREIVFLKYFEQKRNVEIAALLGMKAPTVATRLSRSLQAMRTDAERQGITL